jgi:hypothetical protein
MLALALTLLLPGTVQGEETEELSVAGLRLQASNGYEFFALTALPAAGEEGEGKIALYLRRGRSAFVSYTAPATLSHTTIDADLGNLGRISVTRVPTGRTKKVPQGCELKSKKRVEAERFEGIIEFHGEEGFTDVSATSTPLEYATFCVSGEEGGRPPGKRLPGARLDVERRNDERPRLEFDAVQRRPGAKTLLSIEVEEDRGELDIYRAISTWASPDVLRFDPQLRTAALRPPAPYAGFGRFRSSAPLARQWTGNLTVDLPGRANVRLAGPGLWATLEHPSR